MTNTDKQWAIPMKVTNATIKDFGIDPSEVVSWKIGNRIERVYFVPCTEEQYREYMRAEWREDQRCHRAGKCMVCSEKTGKLIRCEKSCAECEYTRVGSYLSLDAFWDDDAHEPEELIESAKDEFDTDLTLVLMDELINKLKSEDPEKAIIFEMLLDGKTHREIAEAIGRPQQTTTDHIHKLQKYLQTIIELEDIQK